MTRINPEFDFMKKDNWQWMFEDKCGHGGSRYISYRQVVARALHHLLHQGIALEELSRRI